MVVEEGIEVGKKVGMFAFPSFEKITLIITAVVFSVFIIIGSIQSIEQKSFFPLADNTVFRIAGADHKIGQSITGIYQDTYPKGDHWYSWQTIKWAWHWFLFWLGIVANIWFIFFIIYGIYWIAQKINDTSKVRSIIIAVTLFMLIQILVGLLFYAMSMAGHEIKNDKIAILNDAIGHSYPFEGMTKMIVFFVNKDNFQKIYNLANTPIGQAITNIPEGYNLTNATGNTT